LINVPSTFYVHAGLTDGTTYYYVVTAAKAGGESVASAQVSALPQGPSATTSTFIASPSSVVANGVAFTQLTVVVRTTSVFFDGRLYVHDIGGAGLVLDAATGGQLSTFGSRMIPAFKGDVGFFTKAISSTPFGVSLSATSLATGMSSWTFTGDGTLTTPPLVVGDRVFIGSSQGTLFAVDVATGKSSWSATVGAAIPIANEVGLSVALPGLAAGSGVLVVPTQTGLVAFGP
jgi:outer membrane protein assembly factor BamB